MMKGNPLHTFRTQSCFRTLAKISSTEWLKDWCLLTDLLEGEDVSFFLVYVAILADFCGEIFNINSKKTNISLPVQV